MTFQSSRGASSRDTPTKWDLQDPGSAAPLNGWQVPAYPMPDNIKDLWVMRIVVRFGLLPSTAELLLKGHQGGRRVPRCARRSDAARRTYRQGQPLHLQLTVCSSPGRSRPIPRDQGSGVWRKPPSNGAIGGTIRLSPHLRSEFTPQGAQANNGAPQAVTPRPNHWLSNGKHCSKLTWRRRSRGPSIELINVAGHQRPNG